jgi:hypothetical protein
MKPLTVSEMPVFRGADAAKVAGNSRVPCHADTGTRHRDRNVASVPEPGTETGAGTRHRNAVV